MGGEPPRVKAGRRPRVLVLELVTGAPGDGLYDQRVKLPNYLGVMPQAVAAWAEELGSDVTYRTYTGRERPSDLLAGSWDVAFLSAYTRAAYSAYAASSALRRRGVVTALGGPHAIAYPADALEHFDYVCGLTDRDVVARVIAERARGETGCGRWVSAARHPTRLPRLRARAPFLDTALAKARFLRVVPLLSSIGCPFTCDFCSDARTEYSPFADGDVEEDVAFALDRYPGALLFWMDPTFGVRLDPLLAAIERGARGRRVRFGAETTLSLLSGDRVGALARAGCAVLMPGIENWHSYDAKVGRAAHHGPERVRAVADAVNGILRTVPYVQVNFVLGLDGEPHPETFRLTSEFIRQAPGVWPSINLVTAWGTASPLSERLHADGRVLPVPFPLLDQKSCSNVVLSVGSHEELYQGMLAIEDEAFGPSASVRRALASGSLGARIINALRGCGAEMRRRRAWHRHLVDALRADRRVRAFFEGDRVPIPTLLRERALRRIGPFAPLLPAPIAEELRSGRPRRMARATGMSTAVVPALSPVTAARRDSIS